MAKFFGTIGYGYTKDDSLGVWVERIVEKQYFGDVLSNAKRWEGTDHLNDNLNVGNMISIVADAYAYEHYFAMRYIEWMGSKWKITKVEVQRPRLILTIGGVYNGPES